jgi:hypothetical protein
MSRTTYRNMEEFWPDYVRAHRHPLTRWLHFAGTTNLIIWLLLALIGRRPALFLFAVASSYGFAWVGHFLVERNTPLTFRFPILSAVGDLRMYGKMWQGEMDAEVGQLALNTEK